MRRKLIAIATIGLAIGVALSGEQGNAAIETVKRAIQSHGGAQMLTKMKAGKLTLKGTLEAPGGAKTFQEEMAYVMPNKVSRVNKIDGKSVRVLVNGDTRSIRFDGKEVPADEKCVKQLAHASYMLEVGQLVPLVDNDKFKLSPLKDVNIGDGKASGVLVKSEGHEDISLYFDKGTGLLAKSKTKAVDPWSDKTFVEETFFSNYKKVDGLQTAHKVVVYRNEKKHAEMEITGVSYAEELPKSLFE
jgi:hypothetical protein